MAICNLYGALTLYGKIVSDITRLSAHTLQNQRNCSCQHARSRVLDIILKLRYIRMELSIFRNCRLANTHYYKETASS